MSRSGTSRALAVLAVVGSALATSVIRAQDRSTYPTQQSPEKFSIDWVAFYDQADELTLATREELEHRLDIAYGDDPKQRLDVYWPSDAESSPVFVFIHGGGFVEGDRAHYGYVARELGRRGAVTVVMSYRLSPAHYPAQLEDTRNAVAWVYEHIEQYGGDPRRIYVGGHSAGAILSSAVSVNRRWMDERELPRNALRGFFPMSGPYDLRDFGSFVDVYLPQASARAEASPLLNLEEMPPPSVVSYGELEDVFRKQSEDFVEALHGRGAGSRLLALENMNHDETALALGDGTSELARALFELMDLELDRIR